MKDLFKKIYELPERRYREWAPALSIYTAVLVAMQVLYRVRILTMLHDSYAEYRSLTFTEYFSLFGRWDALVVMLLIFGFLVFFLMAGRFRKTALWIISLAITGLGLLFLTAMDFFRVYETTFQTSFWTEENDTAIGELAISILSETSLRYWIFFGILVVTLTVIYRLLKKGYDEADMAEAMTASPAPLPVRIINLFPALVFAVSLIVTAATGSASRIESMAAHYPDLDKRKSVSSLREFAMNPVYNLLFEKKSEGNSTVKTGTESDARPFTFRFQTDALHEKEKFNDLEIIPEGKRYNIILFFFESTAARYIDMDYNGRAITPVWRKLREHSIVMTKHYANFPLSANAMLSVMTSAYDHPSKDLIIQKHSSIGLRSISQVLHEKGYRTCVIHPGDLRYAGQKRFLKYRNFDRIIDYNDMKDTPPYNYKVGWGLDERSMIEPSVAFMKANRDAPFFMVYLPVNPHHPYAIPGKEFRITGDIPVSLDYKKKNWLNYINSLHYADAALGALVDRLEKEGLMKNTLLFLFADHGEAFYEHAKNYNHPFFLYEDNVHVPFMVYNRDLIKETRHYNGISRHIDIMPTILDILEIPGPAEQEGISIFTRHRAQYALLHTYWKDDYMALRDGRWKYIRRMKDGIEELYDIDKDPGETKNLAGDEKSLVEEFRSRIMAGRRHKLEYYEKMLGPKGSLAVKNDRGNKEVSGSGNRKVQ